MRVAEIARQKSGNVELAEMDAIWETIKMTKPECRKVRCIQRRFRIFDIRISFIIRHLSFVIYQPYFASQMNLLINFCSVLFVLVAGLMVLVILMQRPKSEGLGAAFGAGVTENIFGAQTTNVLVKFTTWLAGIFFALTFALSVLYAHQSTASSAFYRELTKNQGAPQTSPAPAMPKSSPSAASPQTSPSHAASAAPNSGAGVLPAGSAAPASSPAATAKP